ncbi:MAG: hypothetical protein Q9201_006927 [Fulgogasparrea decipioides]
MSSNRRYPLLIHLTRPNPSTSGQNIFFTMSEKSRENTTGEQQQSEEQEQPKEQKPDHEHDLTAFLSESQCKDLVLLVATITERMRRAIESNFDAHATLDKDLIGDPTKSEDDKINNPDIDPSKADVVDAYEKEKKKLAEREKELSAPEVKQLKDDALANYDEWRSAFMKRTAEAVHLPHESDKQIAEAADRYEPPANPQAQQHTASAEAGEKVEQKAPKLEDLFPRIKTSLTKLSLAQRRLVLHSVLLLLISLERYSARSRVLLLYLTSSLKLGTKALQEEEVKIAKGLLESAQQINADKEAQEKIEASQQSRKWKTRAATVAGAAVVGISGGMAAPMVASGVGALMGGLGLGATAAAGYLGSVAGSTYLVGALFGAYGGQMTGQMMDNLSREVEDFAFLPVHGRRKEFADEAEAASEERRLRVTIGITGWLTEKEEIIKPWRVLSTGSEVFALRWELETLINLGNSMKTMLSSAAWGYAQSQVIQRTVFAELMASVTWPIGLAKAARVVDNPFTLGKTRADKAGEVLADALMHRAQGQRSVTLIGYSLGARAIYSCLMTLAKRKAFDLVESAILIGAPTPSDTASWRMLKTACSGRLINVYSTNDRVLAFLYRTSSIQYGVAGLAAIEGLPGIENVDVSETVNGHLRYRFLIGKILSQIGLQDLDKEEIKHEEEAYKKMLAEEEEQDYIRQAKEKSQKYLGKKDANEREAEDAEKEAGNMEKEIEQKNQKSMMQWASEQLYISRSTASDPDKAADVGAQALKSGSNAVDEVVTSKNADGKTYYQRAKEKLYLSRSGSKNEDLAKEGISEVGPGYLTQVAIWAAQHLPSWHSATGKAADATSAATQTAPVGKGDESSKGYLASAASYLPSWSSKQPAEAETKGATDKAKEAASTASDVQQNATDQAGDLAKSSTDAGSKTVKNAASTVGNVSQGTTDAVGSGLNKGMSATGAETVGEKTEEVVDAVGVTPKNASEMVGKGGGKVVDTVGDGVQTGVQTTGQAPEQLGKGVSKGAEGAKDGVGKVGEMTGADKGVEKVGEGFEGAKDTAGKAGEMTGADRAGEALSQGAGSVKDTATGATGKLGEGASGLQSGAGKIGESIGLSKGSESPEDSKEGQEAGQEATEEGNKTGQDTLNQAGGAAGLDKGAETAGDAADAAGDQLGKGAQAGQDAVGQGAQAGQDTLNRAGEATGLDKGAEAASNAAGSAGSAVGKGATAGQDAVSNVGEKTGISKGLGKAKFW